MCFLWKYESIYESNTATKCPYSELFWSAFSRIWTEYGEIFRISPYSVQMKENADQNNSEYWHILRILQFFVVAKAFDNFVPELISIRWNMALTVPSYSSEKLKIWNYDRHIFKTYSVFKNIF